MAENTALTMVTVFLKGMQGSYKFDGVYRIDVKDGFIQIIGSGLLGMFAADSVLYILTERDESDG